MIRLTISAWQSKTSAAMDGTCTHKAHYNSAIRSLILSVEVPPTKCNMLNTKDTKCSEQRDRQTFHFDKPPVNCEALSSLEKINTLKKIIITQDRHPKSLVRLHICLPEPIERERRTLSGIRTRVVWLTDCESNHSSMGTRSHRTDCTQTHIHTSTFLWRAKIDGSNSRGFCALLGETGELSDGCFIQALV